MGFLPECNLTCAFLLHSFTFPIAHCPSFSWASFFFTIRPPFPKLALVCTIFS
ncbi:CBM_collapsed_G0002370.mRNA.1.CDS.1 [Saccharomyces cerevisiae]|nr:CBM_collapsed_G0002370.mRNA.1.CDS.1 [Saccharomyces cerevisiae]